MVNPAIVTKDYQDYDTDFIGDSKDAHIRSNVPTFNWGASPSFQVADGAVFTDHTLIELVMPEEEDILGFGELIKVELVLNTISSHAVDVTTAAILELAEIWDEGDKNGAVGECSWDDAQPAVAWRNGGGAILSDYRAIDASETIIDSVRIAANILVDVLTTFDLTEALNMGDRKTFAMFVLDSDAGGVGGAAAFNSKDAAAPADRPILRLTYRSYPPEGFIDDDDKLRIIPNPDDPNQPKLTWGGVDSDDFLQYKLYRDTSPITAIDGFKSAITAVVIGTETLTISGDHTDALPVGSTFKISGSTGNDGRWTVASVTFTGGNTEIVTVEDVTDATVDGDIHHGIWTTTDSAIEEFIDESTLVNGTKYYYRLIAEDQDNHEDGALRSATVFFTKPDVTSATMAPAGAQDVGTQTTMTVISPQNIKRVWVDWKDDTESWYEFETVATSQDVTHIYTEDTGGAITPDVRVEDEFGFWSDVEAASNTFDSNDTTPKAKILVNAKKEVVGSDITLNATLSQPKGSNVTITKYRFRRTVGAVVDTTGTVVADGGNTALTFKTDLPGVDDAYNTKILKITSGPLNGEQRIISDFVNSTDFVTVSVAFSGIPGAGVTFSVSDYYDNGTDPVYTFTTSDLTAATHSAAVEITTSTSLTSTDAENYELETGTPTELIFSNSTKIRSVDHTLPYEKEFSKPLDSAGVEYEFEIARGAERISIEGMSHSQDLEADLDIIRSAWINNTYIRVRVKTENETGHVLYDGKLEADVSLGQAFDNIITWSFPMVVFTRTKDPKEASITAYSDPGGGKVQATSNGHELVNGNTITISGSEIYDGTYIVQNATTNTFRFTGTFVSDTAKGKWRFRG